MACRMLPVPPVVTTPTGVESVAAPAVEHIEGHGDDLGLELGLARTHVALQRVHVGEATEGLGHEPVVLVVAAVHRARALAGLPEGVFLLGHGGELGEDLLAGPSRFGQRAVDGEAILVRVRGHGPER